MVKSTFTSTAGFSLVAAALMAAGACSEPSTSPAPATSPSLSAIKASDVGSSVAWNTTARELITSRGITVVATQARILAYLSVAQYNAIVTAEDAKDGGDHASPAAAAAGASVVVLKFFFPKDVDALNAKMVAQRSAEPWPGEKEKDFAAGEALGRAIGDEVLAYAATDRVGLAIPKAPVPLEAGNWTGVNPVRGHYGSRTFALTSGDQFRPGPPPVFGSDEYKAALAEVRAWSDGLTPAQLAIAQLWAPRGPAYMNSVATGMITSHHRSEREAARVLALANMAGFDVFNACFDAKFAYWYIRPSQADAQIHLPVGLPNHPSYPSGHSCVTSAYATILTDAFPDESATLDAMVVEAGLSRNYGGLHYRFDCEVGQQLGRDVAGQVLRTAPNGHNAIPLD